MRKRKKYTTINYYYGKKKQQSTNDLELAKDRTEKGGHVLLNLSDRKINIYKK